MKIFNYVSVLLIIGFGLMAFYEPFAGSFALGLIGGFLTVLTQTAVRAVRMFDDDRAAKPCPKCDSLHFRMGISPCGLIRVECQGCETKGPFSENTKDAIKGWNHKF